MIACLLPLILGVPLSIRRAQVDISPPEPLPLGGYTDRHGKLMDRGGEPLYTRCILLQQGEKKIAVVSAEMLTIPESLIREVSTRIGPNIHLFLQATHTHSAPDSQMLNDRMTFGIPGIATYRKRWLSWYADQIATCIQDAERGDAFEPKSLWMSTYTKAANRPRRTGGTPDQRNIVVSWSKFPSRGNIVFSFFTAHPTIYDETRNQTSGDWIGELANRTGALVLNGAIGDVSPYSEGKDGEARMRSFFSRFDAKAKGKTERFFSESGQLNWIEEPIELDPMKPHPTFAKENGIPEALAENLVSRFAPPKATIRAFRLGDLTVVGVPGEPTSILDKQIQQAGKRLGLNSVLVCSHVDGWMGYILDPKDYARGGYEATLSFYGANEGDLVVKAATNALRGLAQHK